MGDGIIGSDNQIERDFTDIPERKRGGERKGEGESIV